MNKYTEAIQGDNVVILCDGIPMGVGEILAALNAATPPADAALAERIDALEAVETLRGMVDANAAKWDMPHDEFCTEYMAWSKNRARAFLAKIDAAEGEVPEVVAYRIVNHDSGTTITTDGLLYEAAKVAGMRVDWLAVVGGIPGMLAASGRQDGA